MFECALPHPEAQGKQRWIMISTEDVPPGIVEVAVKVDDHGTKLYDCLLMAGHLGTQHSSDGVTVQPVLGWAIALVKRSKKGETKKRKLGSVLCFPKPARC